MLDSTQLDSTKTMCLKFVCIRIHSPREVNELSSHGATVAAMEIYISFTIFINHKIPFPYGHLAIPQLTYCILQTALYNILTFRHL